jgi:tol-pal system protein YbgF
MSVGVSEPTRSILRPCEQRVAPPCETGRFARRGALAVVTAVTLMLSAHAAHGALFDDDEARKRIAQTNERVDLMQRDLEARLSAIELQLKNQGLVDLFNQVEGMRGEFARLRGQIEVLTYELTEAQKRQRDLYVDIDSRMRKLETAPAAAAPQPPAVAVVAPPASDTAVPSAPPVAPPPQSIAPTLPTAAAEQRAYDSALDQFKRGDYPGAIAGFTNYVKTYPRSPLAASAQYWIGNAQFARKDFRAAITSQRQLLQAYPESSKVPDALLNIASAQSELGDNAAARRTLEELIAKFPQSESAGKAKQRLGMR